MADSFFALEKRKTNLDGTDTLGYVCKFTLEPPRVPPVIIPPYVDTSPIPVSNPTIPTYGVWDWWDDVVSFNQDFRPILVTTITLPKEQGKRRMCVALYIWGIGDKIKNMTMPCRAISGFFQPVGGYTLTVPPGLPDIGTPL